MRREIANILEMNISDNTWNPPAISEKEMAMSVRYDENALQSSDYLYIFQTTPYIDSIYIDYDTDRKPVLIRRFTFHEGYTWDFEKEEFFHENCIKSRHCSYNSGQIEHIYQWCCEVHPEWHVPRYYTKGLRVLDHIYNCLKEGTAKEMLYKCGLDDLAADIYEIDELNLIATKPSDLYDGLSMKVLQSVNCPNGAVLIRSAETRKKLKELDTKFPMLFKNKLNDAMCRYLSTLIKDNFTAEEVVKLFESRRSNLARVWTMSVYDTYMDLAERERKIMELCKIYGRIDPIYEEYIRGLNNTENDYRLQELESFLFHQREEYDKAIRRSNRKRDYDWMERGKDYYIRYPQTINDFCRESIYMRDYLLDYVDEMIEGDTTFLFMRRCSNVNMPFITIKVFKNELMRTYHRLNADCGKEEAIWIIEYCKRHGINTGKFI